MKEFENNEFDKELADLISMEVDQILQEIAREEAQAESESNAEALPIEDVTEELSTEEVQTADDAMELSLAEDAAEAEAEQEAVEETGEDAEMELTEEEMDAARMQALHELYPDDPVEEETPRKLPIKPIVLGIVAAVVLMLAALLGGTAMYVKGLDTIYPKVSVMDVELGGMTVEQAEAALEAADVGDMARTAIVLNMPGGSLELTYADVGFMHPAHEIVQMAYAYGREGGTVSNTMRYLSSVLFSVDLTERVMDPPSEGYIEALLENAILKAEVELNGEVTFDPEAQTLTVIKGAQNIHLDRKQMLRMLMDAIENREYGELTYQPKAVNDTAEEIAMLREQFCAEVKDAYYDKETGQIVPEVIGVEFDDAAMAAQWDAAQVGETIALNVIVTMPEETEAHLKQVLFSQKFAESVTTLKTSSSNRKNNVGKAVEKLNGVILMPGEQLSYNQLLGRRTPENGYLEADAYLGGQVVKEYGGGICQVSSALYYCALLSQLQIDERTNHTFRVSYMPYSYDATVSWGGPDFKFTNNRDYPIRINASMTSSELTVSIEGTDNGKYAKLTYTSSYGYTNPDYPDVATGIVSEATRWIYDSATNALLTKERLGRDFYQYHEEEIQYPSPTPEATPEPTPAMTPSPTPVVTPSPTPVVTPSPTPMVVTPTPMPTPEPTPVPTPEPTPESTPVPEASGTEPTEQSVESSAS